MPAELTVTDMILIHVENHHWDKAQRLAEKEFAGEETQRERDFGAMSLYFRRCTAEDIEKGLALTRQRMGDRDFRICREMILNRKIKLLRLTDEAGTAAERTALQAERVEILKKLMDEAENDSERHMWECKLATAEGKTLAASTRGTLLHITREAETEAPREEALAFVDHVIAINDCVMAEFILKGRPVLMDSHTQRDSWGTLDGKLTPNNRRGFGLYILHTQRTPTDMIARKFESSHKLGLNGVCRDMAYMLKFLKVDGAQALAAKLIEQMSLNAPAVA